MYKGIIAIATVIIALISWILVLGYNFFFIEKKKNSIPIKIYIALFLGILLFSLPIISFCKIAYDMWDSKGHDGSTRYVESLAFAHLWFIMICIILVINLIRRFSRKDFTMPMFSVISSFIFLICISISFFYTVPREGDDLIMLWLFLMPGFFITGLILLTTIFIFAISSIIRQIKQSSTGYQVTENPATLNEE